MSHANGHRHVRRRLPDHVVRLVEEAPTPWYEHEVALVVGSALALSLTLFSHAISDSLGGRVDPVYVRPGLYGAAFVLGVLCMRGAGNTLRSAGSVNASNTRLLVAAFAGLAVMFASALALFSLFGLLDHLLG